MFTGNLMIILTMSQNLEENQNNETKSVGSGNLYKKKKKNISTGLLQNVLPKKVVNNVTITLILLY